MDMDNVISNLEQQIRWIEEIECHKFPGWLNVTNAIRDALSMLKEYDTQVQYRDDHIAEYEKEIKRLNKLLKEQEEKLKFLDALYNYINPNDMEQYMQMYRSLPVPSDGRSVK